MLFNGNFSDGQGKDEPQKGHFMFISKGLDRKSLTELFESYRPKDLYFKIIEAMGSIIFEHNAAVSNDDSLVDANLGVVDATALRSNMSLQSVT